MKICERCQKTFECGAADKNQKCWCMEMPKAVVPEEFKDCLCADCLKLFIPAEDQD